MSREIIRKQSGFSLVELIITMTVFIIVIAAASSIFVPLLTQFKQQSKIAESQVERLVGLDILRRDIEQAGYGLPWVIDGVNYKETVADGATGWVERDYNDGPDDNPARGDELGDPACNPPGAIRNGNNVAGTLNNSDVLVIKATSIATNDAASKWTYVVGAGGGGNLVNTWTSALEDLNNGDRVIVIIPIRGEENQRILVNSSGNFNVQFNVPLPAAYAPSTPGDVYLIYGVDPDTDLRMPFNRADYYVERPAGPAPDDMPPRCAQNTGILYKGVVNNSLGAGGGEKTQIRLLECVADMQLIFGWDADEDGNFEHPGIIPGSADAWLENLNIYTAEEIRDHLKEVRVYILAHEGQRDSGYNFNGFTGGCATCVMVGEFGLGRDVNLMAVIPDYQEYRWKVYTVVVKPPNLRE